jgi:plastocyanin
MRFGWKGGVVVAALLAALGCGSDDGDGNNTPAGPTITIDNLTYSPADLTVDAGATITIVNNDDMQHTVTSETADNAFTPGAVGGVSFDTGLIATGGGGGGNPSPPPGGPYVQAATASITIPSNAPSGTVIPFYCQNHKGAMNTPNGHITVR